MLPSIALFMSSCSMKSIMKTNVSRSVNIMGSYWFLLQTPTSPHSDRVSWGWGRTTESSCKTYKYQHRDLIQSSCKKQHFQECRSPGSSTVIPTDLHISTPSCSHVRLEGGTTRAKDHHGDQHGDLPQSLCRNWLLQTCWSPGFSLVPSADLHVCDHSHVRLDGVTTENNMIIEIKIKIFSKISAKRDTARSIDLLGPRWTLLLTSTSPLCPAVE